MSRLISGNPYSLQEIFFGDNDKIIIPDLQRDYCWGNPFSKDSKESLVDSFIDSVFQLDKKKDITMGLIYGYYDKLKPYHLQLCDGQQRLTTLFLIMGVINRYTDNKYQHLLISDFELHEDDKEPHLLYGIRESSLYFLSDLTTHYFLNPTISYGDITSQYWFLNSYNQDPTIKSVLKAIASIEARITTYGDVEELGEFLLYHLKFLFYDMTNRRNGEETFVVINTTGEPLTANQNLKPLVIIQNQDYKRHIQHVDGTFTERDTAQDWEEMETWFWRHRRLNDIDTSTEGMLAFLHCVRVLESPTEKDWYNSIDIDEDKFPVSIKMFDIWEWFCAYKRVYELDYSLLHTPNIQYPEKQLHYTQKNLYSLLPTMSYCRKNKDATDLEIQRVYHLFYNMGRYRETTRSSHKDAIRVPAYRASRLIYELPSKDILLFLEIPSFDITEEKTKLELIKEYKDNEAIRNHIEQLFAKAENSAIFDGQIATFVNWSQLSIEKLDYFYNRINELWILPTNLNKLRRALLAFGLSGYPMATGSANRTLCSKTEWRTLFEKRGEQIISFMTQGDLDDIIANYANEDSPFYPIIHDDKYLEFSRDHNIRIHPQGVVELMAKTYASADFLLFHRGVIFEKNMVNTNKWNGFWVWSEEDYSVFYSTCNNYDITLDMSILDEGYLIIARLGRRPNKPSVKTLTLENLGFYEKDGEWVYPVISSPIAAKEKFIELTQGISS